MRFYNRKMNKNIQSQAWLQMTVIPTLRRLRSEFESKTVQPPLLVPISQEGRVFTKVTFALFVEVN